MLSLTQPCFFALLWDNECQGRKAPSSMTVSLVRHSTKPRRRLERARAGAVLQQLARPGQSCWSNRHARLPTIGRVADPRPQAHFDGGAEGSGRRRGPQRTAEGEDAVICHGHGSDSFDFSRGEPQTNRRTNREPCRLRGAPETVRVEAGLAERIGNDAWSVGELLDLNALFAGRGAPGPRGSAHFDGGAACCRGNLAAGGKC